MRETLIQYAADTKDHTVSDTFAQLLRPREMLKLDRSDALSVCDDECARGNIPGVETAVSILHGVETPSFIPSPFQGERAV